MYVYYYSSCNWKYDELLHQCKGNVNYCLALCSCVVVLLLSFCVFFGCFLHVNKSSSQKNLAFHKKNGEFQ